MVLVAEFLRALYAFHKRGEFRPFAFWDALSLFAMLFDRISDPWEVVSFASSYLRDVTLRGGCLGIVEKGPLFFSRVARLVLA